MKEALQKVLEVEMSEFLISAWPLVRGTNLDCTQALCGAGMLDVDAALRAAHAFNARVVSRGEASLILHADGSVRDLGRFVNGDLGDGIANQQVRTVPVRAAGS